jgi:hypothetical protein
VRTGTGNNNNKLKEIERQRQREEEEEQPKERGDQTRKRYPPLQGCYCKVDILGEKRVGGAGEAMAVVQQRYTAGYREKIKKTHEMHSGRRERQSAKP